MRKLFAKPLNLLLIFVPIAIIAELGHWSPVIIFLTAALISASSGSVNIFHWLPLTALLSLDIFTD